MKPIDNQHAKKIAMAQNDFEKNQDKYAEKYDENVFLKIVKKLPEATTRPFVTLYYIMKSPGITTKEKALCLTALGYVVLPLDIIPDAIPMIGWLDDLGVVTVALNSLKEWSETLWVQEHIEKFYEA